MRDRSPSKKTEGRAMKAGLLYMIGNIAGQAIVLLSTPIFTRLMDSTAWGIVSTYAAWALIINAVIGLNLHISMRNAFTDFPQQVDAFASSVLTLSFFSFIGCSSFILGGLWIFGGTQYLLLGAFLAVQAYSLFVINFYNAKLAMEFRYSIRTFFLIVPNLVHTLLSLLLVQWLPWQKYNSKILGNVLGYFLFGCIAFVVVMKQGKTLYHQKYWRYGLKISIPAIGYSLSDLILMQCDRIMITSFVSASATAVYSMAYNVGAILWIISTGTGSAWMPWFNQQLNCGRKDKIQKYTNYYLAVFVIMALGLLCIAPELLMLLTPQEYWVGKAYFGPFVLTAFLMFLYAFPMNLQFYHKKTGQIACNTFVTSAVNFILNFYFIQRFGAIAAAYTTMFSYALLFALQWRGAKKIDAELFSLKPFVIATSVVASGAVFYQVIYPFIWIRYTLCVLLLLGLGIYCQRNWKKILALYKDFQ